MEVGVIGHWKEPTTFWTQRSTCRFQRRTYCPTCLGFPLGERLLAWFRTFSALRPRRDLSGGWHKFASSFIQAPVAGFPFSDCALPLTAVKFAKRRLFRDFLHDLVPDPPPDPANRLVAFQLLFGHAVEPSIQIRELPRLSGIIHPTGRRESWCGKTKVIATQVLLSFPFQTGLLPVTWPFSRIIVNYVR
jgi:hypothetical protein